jgi:thiol-disulfide isomerase/thioredoxin
MEHLNEAVAKYMNRAALLLFVALCSCGGSPPSPTAISSISARTATNAPKAPVPSPQPAPQRHSDAPGIQWFDGDIAAAFDSAKQAGKPVLLYWGAIWCPPCQQLKATVFSRPDFIAKSQLFVSVYLDGDDPGAQRWGETFKVTGYPTMLVLDANQRELQRIAGGMDLGEYPAVLDAALADSQPVDALLHGALAGRHLSKGQCHRLAYNAWSLAEVSPQDFSARAKQLTRASDACPAAARSERVRLRLMATDFAARAEADNLDKGAAPSAFLAAQIGSLARVLANHALA